MALKATMLLCMAVAASTAVSAEPAPADALSHSRIVHFTDVNFNQPAEVAALYQRITYAADQVCGPRALTGTYYTSPDYTRCYNEAINEAVARVNRPELTAFYKEQLARNARLASK